MLSVGDSAFEELASVGDAEELCRRLLASPSGWGTSMQHTEAVELLANVHGTSDLPASLVALMVCACTRWRRVTAKLIAALEGSALLDQTELDDLAELFLVPEPVISYPLAWLSPQWLDVDLADGTSRIHAIDNDTLARHPVSLKPPLRRWAAERAMRSDASRLRELLRDTELFAPRHRDALIHGLLDAGDVLDEASRRELIDRGLTAGQSSVRRAALERLCELDGADPALRRARNDPSASIRTWQPPVPQLAQSTLL